MKLNSPSQNLKQNIALLEIRQQEEWLSIKEQVNIIEENLKPIKIIKSVLNEICSNTVGSKSNILKTVFRIGIGFLGTKILKGTAQNKFKTFVDSFLSLN